jgi:exodeoxyribonuclease V gamma subunit
VTLHLHRAARTDRLADGLAELLQDPPGDAFAEDYVVVPARGIERWLAQRLSHRLGVDTRGGDGVCAGVRFVSPSSLVSLLLDRERDDPWHPDQMVWPLLSVIDASLGEPWCPALSAHLGFGMHGEQAQLRRDRRYTVARRLAGLFASYAVQRPALLRDWAAGRPTDGAGQPLADDLAWQPELWRRLVSSVDMPAPDRRHADTVAAIEAGTELALPARLSLFGHTRLPGTEVELLAAVAKHRDVHLWLPQVSAELWDRLVDVVAAGPVPRADDPSREQVRHPLLAALGRDARELQRTLAVAGHVDDQPDERTPAERASLLGWLQADLRANRSPSPGERAGRELGSDDHSVQVHACHGQTRQVDVLREVLAGLLQDDPTLEPRDVVVMCPDIDAYAPLVQAGFGLAEPGRPARDAHPAHRLRVRLADRGLGYTNPLLELAQRLVALAGSRVTATAVLDLAGSEPVRHRFGFTDDDLAQLARWVEQSGVRWGLDAPHRAAYHLETVAQNTWRTGLDRVLLGVAMAEDEGRWLGGTLPVDDLPSSAVGLAGRFAEYLDRLAFTVDQLSSADGSIARTADGDDAAQPDLVAALADGVAALAAVPDRQSWQVTQFDAEMVAMAPAGSVGDGGAAPPGRLRLADLRALLEHRLAGRPTRASFRTGTLTVSTLVPMRSVPHRVVCLLGLDDGVFPRQTSIDGDDVLARRPMTGERDARSEDRQLLLDAVMAATETLVVTYSGADEHTGQRRPPAVPLGELLDALDRTAAEPVRDQIVTQHPLQPFDPRNLDGQAPFSFDKAALAGATAAAGDRHRRPAFLTEPLAPLAPLPDVSLTELRDLLANPAGAFLRQRLDVTLPREADEPSDAIPIDLDGLRRWAIGERVLRRLVAGMTQDHVCLAELLRGEVPPGRLGQDVLTELLAPVQSLLQESAEARAGGPGTVDVSVDIGSRRLTGSIPDVYADGIVRLTYSTLSPKHRLLAWVDLLALTVTQPDRPCRALIYTKLKRGSQRTSLNPVDPDEARDHLTALLDVYDRGLREPLPLPVKTGCAFAEQAVAGRPALAEKMGREAWQTDRNKDWGPPGEQDDPANVAVYGPSAPFEVLRAPPRAGEHWCEAPHRLGQYAWRVWQPLLCHEAKS